MNRLLTVFLFVVVTCSMFSQNFWEEFNIPNDSPVYDFSIAPNGDFLACSYWASFSTDRGASWIHADNVIFQEEELDLKDVLISMRKTAATGNGYMFWAPHDGFLFRSTDNGASWHIPNMDINDAATLTIDNNDVLYVEEDGLQFSEDYGETWIKPTVVEDFPDEKAGDIRIGPENIVIAAFSTGVAIRENGSDTWTSSQIINWDDEYIQSICVYGDKIYCQSDKAFYVSDDKGLTWTKAYSEFDELYNTYMECSPDGKIFIVGRDGGHFVSVDEGQSWAPALEQFENWPVFKILFDQADIYLATNGMYKSTDGGATFEKLESQPGYPIGGIAQTGESENFVATPGHLYQSIAAGDTWSILEKADFNASELGLFMGDPYGNIYMSERGGSLLQSTDGGNSWITLDMINDPRQRFSWISAKGDIFIGNWDDNIICSTDMGMSWITVEVPNYVYFSGHGLDNEIMIASLNDSIYVSYDYGKNWTSYDITIGSSPHIQAIAKTGENIFAFTYDGVFRSSDNFSTWEPVEEINDKLIYSAENWEYVFEGRSIYVACDAGIFRSSDKGESWEELNSGLNSMITMGLYHGMDKHLYLITKGGAFRSSEEVVSVNDKIACAGSSLKIYPSPAGDYFNIELILQTPLECSLELRDISGRLLMEKDLGIRSAGVFTDRIDCPELIPGVYIASFIYGAERISKIISIIK